MTAPKTGGEPKAQLRERSPGAGSAGELLALLEIREGKTAEAVTRLRALAADSTLPETLTERAGRLADTIGAKE